jgi:hypothetical protein
MLTVVVGDVDEVDDVTDQRKAHTYTMYVWCT